MEFKVIFTGKGLYHTAYFCDDASADYFACLMASEGRLYKAFAQDIDITNMYSEEIKLGEVVNR